MDAISQSRLTGLHPVLIERLINLDSQLTANSIEMRISQALRSWAYQAGLYAQGRTAPGVIVTDAEPGQSWHNYGFAVDIVPLVNGVCDWNDSGPIWQKIYSLLPGCGFFSGKDYSSRFKDPDHIQLSDIPESPTAEDIQDLKDAGMAAVWTRYFPAS
jgi:peptidoglycan LD-endopeptidase CwlK